MAWFDWFTSARRWGSNPGTILTEPTQAQAKQGWGFIGSAPPTVEQFDAIEQVRGDQLIYLYNLIDNVVKAGGLTQNGTALTTLLQAINALDTAVRTALLAELAAQIASVNTLRYNGDQALNSALLQEQATRFNEDTKLYNGLANETTARAAQDTALLNSINANIAAVNARIDAVNAYANTIETRRAQHGQWFNGTTGVVQYFTVPAEVYFVHYRQQGAGGAGGAGASSKNRSAGGGGSGGYAEGMLNVNPGNVFAVYNGNGGQNNSDPNWPAPSGETSWISGPNISVTTTGGGGGAGANMDTSAGGEGGTGYGGAFNLPGGQGNDGSAVQAAATGKGADSFFGYGGRAATDGQWARGYGAGGGGSWGNQGIGGGGAGGLTIFQWGI